MPYKTIPAPFKFAPIWKRWCTPSISAGCIWNFPLRRILTADLRFSPFRSLCYSWSRIFVSILAADLRSLHYICFILELILMFGFNFLGKAFLLVSTASSMQSLNLVVHDDDNSRFFFPWKLRCQMERISLYVCVSIFFVFSLQSNLFCPILFSRSCVFLDH